MQLSPDYGNTLLPDDELVYLLPEIRDALSEPITKADIYALEEAELAATVEHLLPRANDGDLSPENILTVGFVQGLHRELYGGIWTWGGKFRQHNTNIGVDKFHIAVELHAALGDILYRWSEAEDLSPRELGIAAHAATVRIHPFADGNGRCTRLLGDLVFVAAQDGITLEQYDWNIDKSRYIDLLRQYDGHRNPSDLSQFIAVVTT